MKILLLLAAAAYLCAADKPATWEGTLVDSNCYLKDNSLTGNDHMGMKDCGTACLKSGLPAGLVTRDKKYRVIIARAPALAPYVGQQVRVTGAAKGDAIMAEKVEVNKNGKWEAVNIKAMM